MRPFSSFLQTRIVRKGRAVGRAKDESKDAIDSAIDLLDSMLDMTRLPEDDACLGCVAGTPRLALSLVMSSVRIGNSFLSMWSEPFLQSQLSLKLICNGWKHTLEQWQALVLHD